MTVLTDLQKTYDALRETNPDLADAVLDDHAINLREAGSDAELETARRDMLDDVRHALTLSINTNEE